MLRGVAAVDGDAPFRDLRARTLEALAELGVPAAADVVHADPRVFPVVDVTDAATFKASFPLYPQGVALGLLAWRRAKSAEAGAAKL